MGTSMDEISIEERLPTALKDGILIVAFPSRGLASTIAGRYVIDALNLEEIGWITAEDLMPATIVHQGTALPPIRINAKVTPTSTIAVIVSEFPIPEPLITPLANKILSWAAFKEFTMIYTLEGIKGSTKPVPQVYGIGSTPTTRHLLADQNIPPTHDGMVLGLSGVLLYLSAIEHRDILLLLANAHASYPDSRAAAGLIEHLARLIPDLHVDLGPLYQEAEEIEESVRTFLKETEQTPPSTKLRPITQMYG
jgi:predicted ATP-grasp superfamily ATP-dependent carboligase